MRRGATPRSRQLQRTRSTCRPTSLRGSATGRIHRLQCRIRSVAKLDNSPHDQLHAMDYQVYGYLQLGQDTKAKALIDEMEAVGGFTELHSGAVCAGHISGALRDRARRLEDGRAVAGPAQPPVACEGHHAFRAGARRSPLGNPAAAKADVAKLAELRDKSREAKDAYWSEQIDIQHQVASAWVLYAEGKYDDALKAMSAAADAEDKTEKHPVTPGVPKPAREQYADPAARTRQGQGGAC